MNESNIEAGGRDGGHTYGQIDGPLAVMLRESAEKDASDIHLTPGYPLTYRVHGRLVSVGGEAMTPQAVRGLIERMLPPRLHRRLDDAKDIDCSLETEFQGKPCRFRANIFIAEANWCACLRRVPQEIPTLAWMGIREQLAETLIGHNNGLVIITGVTGSGKTTTLAGLIHLLNARGGYRIITVEEPIEYVHQPISSSVITQREVGRDVDSFFNGLKFGLRQDPDVILVGEIRDRETAQMALSAAETGHLIFSTMHTQDAKGAVTRFVDLFPYEAQSDVRTQLSLSLRSIVNQHLIPSTNADGKRALATEIMHANSPVRTAIRQGKIESLESAIQTGKRDGMVTLDEDLSQLCMQQKITLETARRFAKDPSQIGSF